MNRLHRVEVEPGENRLDRFLETLHSLQQYGQIFEEYPFVDGSGELCIQPAERFIGYKWPDGSIEPMRHPSAPISGRSFIRTTVLEFEWNGMSYMLWFPDGDRANYKIYLEGRYTQSGNPEEVDRDRKEVMIATMASDLNFLAAY